MPRLPIDKKFTIAHDIAAGQAKGKRPPQNTWKAFFSKNRDSASEKGRAHDAFPKSQERMVLRAFMIQAQHNPEFRKLFDEKAMASKGFDFKKYPPRFVYTKSGELIVTDTHEPDALFSFTLEDIKKAGLKPPYENAKLIQTPTTAQHTGGKPPAAVSRVIGMNGDFIIIHDPVKQPNIPGRTPDKILRNKKIDVRELAEVHIRDSPVAQGKPPEKHISMLDKRGHVTAIVVSLDQYENMLGPAFETYRKVRGIRVIDQ